ncbi:MAG: GNAT family N-acetyltransferase [Acidimicrobiales bacterium]
MARVRLGVALLVGGDLADQVDGLRRAVGDPALARIPPHITLVPPVNVAEARLPEALALVRAAAAATGPIDLVLGPPATFWPVSPVVYLAVGGDLDAVVDLRALVFRPPLARTVSLPFVPHVTLADGVPAERIEAALVAMAAFRVTARFDRVHLLQEGPGRVWAPVADAAFAAPAVLGRGGLELELSLTQGADPEVEAFVAARPAVAADRFTVAARRDGAVVGVAGGHTSATTTVLDRLVVDAAYQGQGIGTHLVAAVESLAVERGCGAVSARVAAATRAAAFLRGRGWVEVPPGPAATGDGDVELRRSL